MKLRHVFSTRDASHALVAVRLLHAQGIDWEAISLVARDDIELDQVPHRMKEADTDLMPAAARGMAIGGATGVLAGLAAMVVPALGVTLAGAAALGAAGALVGGWSSALMCSAIPDPVRQRFEAEIAAGRVLVLVDADEPTQARLEPLLIATGAQRLGYETHSALA
jgi:hypothetical protein